MSLHERINTDDLPQEAILCAVHLPEVSEIEFRESLEELAQLAKTLGLRVVGEIVQKRSSFDSAAYLGPGRIEDLKTMVGAASEQIVLLVDHEISPSQARNMEEATQAAGVLDRTAVILEIFHRHAHSRQAKLQVEMVRLAYMAPRMREVDHPEDRQRGYIGGRGAGESAIELDRRKIRDRLAELRKEIDDLSREKVTQRSRRQGFHRVAVCGYTNAGKSTLFHALTQSDVYIADKLFATLDTTVRVLQETGPKILISDTIGFIRNLPTQLVASFRSTLDETLESDLLLHVVDVSDPAWERQMNTTRQVLTEIGAGDIPQMIVLNKIDRLADKNVDLSSVQGIQDTLLISAYQPLDIDRVRQKIIDFFDSRLVETQMILPYAHQELRGQLFEHAHVLEESFLDEGVCFRFRAEPDWISRWQAQLSQYAGTNT